MQTPKRKPGKYTNNKPDPYMTQGKFDELKNKLENLKKKQPFAASEVKRLALDGDFSENAAYQIAKGRLRGLNQRILDIENHLKNAMIIKPSKTGRVCLGSQVTVEVNGKQKTYQILGSSETDPSRGIISHNSPIGSALINKKLGDIVKVKIKDKEVEYKIVKIK